MAKKLKVLEQLKPDVVVKEVKEKVDKAVTKVKKTVAADPKDALTNKELTALLAKRDTELKEINDENLELKARVSKAEAIAESYKVQVETSKIETSAAQGYSKMLEDNIRYAYEDAAERAGRGLIFNFVIFCLFVVCAGLLHYSLFLTGNETLKIVNEAGEVMFNQFVSLLLIIRAWLFTVAGANFIAIIFKLREFVQLKKIVKNKEKGLK